MKNLANWDLIATGDVFLQNKTQKENPFTKGVEELFRKSKLALINLETTLGNGGTPIEKAYCFQASSVKASYLKRVEINIANVANNHTQDFGIDGFKETLRILNDNNINYLGAKNIKNKENFHISHLDNLCIGFLAYHGNKSLSICEINETNIQNDILRLKQEKVDRIIVNLHWGEEYVPFPTPQQQQLARKIIDFGADVIIGHHPHVLQGIEHYNGGLIFYSLGNFNFNVEHKYHNKLETTNYGICIKFHFLKENSETKYEIIPVYVNNSYQPCLFNENTGLRILKYIESISLPLKNDISYFFWIQQASIHYFNNHIPSFVLRIRKYGYRHIVQFLIWLIHPYNLKYYVGLILSVINKKKRYSL